MSRLHACPSCRRHVQVAERSCPFCGFAGFTAAAPARWSAALLGLCLAACSGAGQDGASKAGPADKAGPETNASTPEAEPTPEPESNSQTGGETGTETGGETGTETGSETGTETGETTGAPEPESSEGTDAGASPEPVQKRPEMKTKYGGPRPPPDPPPKKKYGAPRPDPF